MLVGACRIGIADHDVFALLHRTDAVGNDAVVRKVAATDDVTGAGRRNRHDRAPLGIGKEAVLVGMSHQLGTRLGIAVGVEAVEFLVLAVAPVPLAVQVDLVGRHVQKRLDAVGGAHALEDVDRPHDVRLVSVGGILVRIANNRLRRKVQHHFGFRFVKGLLEGRLVADIADDRTDIARDVRNLEQRRIRRRFKRIARHLSSRVREHLAEPAPLEAGMARHKDAPAPVKIV